VLADQGAAQESGAGHHDGHQDQRDRRQLGPRPPGQHGGKVVVVVRERTRQHVEQVIKAGASAGVFFWL
jgi:hypothetical protein